MKSYTVGIDLGTSNTVLAYVEAGSDDIRVFDVDQLVSPGEVGARALLPSVRYHPAAGELDPGDLQLPWSGARESSEPPAVVGQLARKLGAQVPGRLVSSAKSWLSHASVDRLAPILPWGVGEEVGKVSPVTASASYLAHVRDAWNYRFPRAPLENQDVVLTVPASFDDGARALTMEAARRANLPALRLLEEPQAAFYDWLFRHRATLATELADTRLVLICDVGGGTTDLTLIKVHVENGEPQLTRIGVGNHLMLGGDNMDLALARFVEARIATQQTRLSAASLSQLVERCRAAKEQILADEALDSVGVTLLGSGAKLVGGARTVELTRQEIEQIVLEGFFPMVEPDELPRRARSAIVEFGLPYASDPAITRHVAAFLNRFAGPSREALNVTESARETPSMPDTLLLNGGVFRSRQLAGRLSDTLAAWRAKPLHVLQNEHPDVAVARGAVAYGLARAGQAPRIGGGSPRSYLLVVDDDEKVERGVCLLPRGTQEGHEVRLEDRLFALRLGHPVRFHLVSTAADTAYRQGELVDLASGDFVRLPPIATVVQPQHASGPHETRVKLATTLTEIGTLDMHCIGADDVSQRWSLEFQLRRDAAESPNASEAAPSLSLDKAKGLIDRAFGARSADVGPKETRRLRSELEQILGARESWDSALLRQMFGALWERARRRRRSADHERSWLNLAGYCIRPGFGYPLDEWRVEQLWSLFDDGIQYVNDGRVWSEWWTLWRRAAGGLGEAAQLQLLDAIDYLEPANMKRRRMPFDPAKVGHADMVLLCASLERVPVERKVDMGEQLLARLKKSSANQQQWWAIGRIGTRLPFYGSAHGVVPPEVATRWLDEILALDWKKTESAVFAAVQVSRMTGDRSRDLPLAVRESVARRLEAAHAPQRWVQMVRETVELDDADSVHVFGETLPTGLKLIAE
jgi:molecular chaperone DnaK (HSP70)